jgi:chromosome segregation ATPase
MLESQVDVLRGDVALTQGALEKGKDEVAKFAQLNTQKAHENSQLEDELARVKQELVTAEGAYRDLHASFEASSGKAAELTQVECRGRARKAVLEAGLAHMQEELCAGRKAWQEAEDQCKTWQHVLDLLQAQLATLGAKFSMQLDAVQTDFDRRRAALEAELEDAQFGRSTVEDELAEAHSLIAQAHSQIAQAHSQIATVPWCSATSSWRAPLSASQVAVVVVHTDICSGALKGLGVRG